MQVRDRNTNRLAQESRGVAMDCVAIADPGANTEAVFSAARPSHVMVKEIGHAPHWRPLRNFN